MAVEELAMEASQAPPPPDEVVARKSTWTGVKEFLTQGNARWQTLGVLLLLGAIVGVVTTNTGVVNNLRQNLLLKNHHAFGQGEVHKIRASLSGMDPLHHNWDDVKALRRGGGHGGMQLPGMQQEGVLQDHIGQAVTSEDDRIRNDCMAACRANGYSPARAGPAATKACVDVCLEEKGLRPLPSAPAPAGPQGSALTSPRAMATLRSRSVHSRGRASQASQLMGSAQRLLARLQSGVSGKSALRRGGGGGAGSMQEEMTQLGVNGMKLPQTQGAQLAKGIKMDSLIGDEEEKTAGKLHAEWEAAEHKMVTVEAARLTNAKNLARAARKAEKENLAKEKLDESLVAAAQNYAQTVGSEHGLPMNAAKAQKQLASSQADDATLREAAQTAADIYREEKELWASVKPLTQKQLAGAEWVMPGEVTQEAQWGKVLDGAAAMPHTESKAVRLAAMSNGKLMGMEKAEFEKNRASTLEMTKHLRDLQAARAANAEQVRKRMEKAAAKKAAEAQLLQAENKFVSAGGKLGPESSILGAAEKGAAEGAEGVAQDQGEVRELRLAARGAAAMLQRYSEQLKSGVEPLVQGAEQRTQHGAAASGGDDSILGRLEKGFKAVTGATTGAEAGEKGAAKGGDRGEKGVEDVAKASKGWFHW